MWIADYVRTLLEELEETGLVLFLLKLPMLRCREALECLPDAIKRRCTVSTLDAAQGLEADHVSIVCMPRADGTVLPRRVARPLALQHLRR